MERASTAREGEHKTRTRTVKLALEFGGSRPVRALWCVLLPYDRANGREGAIRRNSPNALQILTHVGVRIVLCTVRPHHDMKLWACS